MPHFNDQYPSMEDIKEEHQRKLTHENNKLLKQQNELLREILGRENKTTIVKEDSDAILKDLEDTYKRKLFI